jgi:hypothetical protein
MRAVFLIRRYPLSKLDEFELARVMIAVRRKIESESLNSTRCHTSDSALEL